MKKNYTILLVSLGIIAALFSFGKTTHAASNAVVMSTIYPDSGRAAEYYLTYTATGTISFLTIEFPDSYASTNGVQSGALAGTLGIWGSPPTCTDNGYGYVNCHGDNFIASSTAADPTSASYGTSSDVKYSFAVDSTLHNVQNGTFYVGQMDDIGARVFTYGGGTLFWNNDLINNIENPYTPSSTPPTTPTSTTPAINFIWPLNDGVATVLFDNFLVKGYNLTSSDEYQINGSWYLGLNQQTTNFTPITATGAQIECGILIPLHDFPNVCPTGNLCSFVALPANATANLYDTTNFREPDNLNSFLVAATTTAFNINAQGNTTSTTSTYLNITNPSCSLSTATTTSGVNPFYSSGAAECPIPQSLTDYGGIWANALCQAANTFIYPHQFSKDMITGSFTLLQGDPPFNIVFGLYDYLGAEGTALETATTTDLNLAFSFRGYQNLIPTTTIPIINNTAFAALSGNSTLDASIHSDLFSAEDSVMTLLLFALMYLTITGVKKHKK